MEYKETVIFNTLDTVYKIRKGYGLSTFGLAYGRSVGYFNTWVGGLFEMCQVIDILSQNNFFVSEEQATQGLLMMMKFFPEGYEEITERLRIGNVDLPRFLRANMGSLGDMDADYIFYIIGRRVKRYLAENETGFVSRLGIDPETGGYCLKIKMDGERKLILMNRESFEANFIVLDKKLRDSLP